MVLLNTYQEILCLLFTEFFSFGYNEEAFFLLKKNVYIKNMGVGIALRYLTLSLHATPF